MDMMQVFFINCPGLLRTISAAVCAYASMILVLRVAGKHALSKLHVLGYIVTVARASQLNCRSHRGLPIRFSIILANARDTVSR